MLFAQLNPQDLPSTERDEVVFAEDYIVVPSCPFEDFGAGAEGDVEWGCFLP